MPETRPAASSSLFRRPRVAPPSPLSPASAVAEVVASSMKSSWSTGGSPWTFTRSTFNWKSSRSLSIIRLYWSFSLLYNTPFYLSSLMSFRSSLSFRSASSRSYSTCATDSLNMTSFWSALFWASWSPVFCSSYSRFISLRNSSGSNFGASSCSALCSSLSSSSSNWMSKIWGSECSMIRLLVLGFLPRCAVFGLYLLFEWVYFEPVWGVTELFWERSYRVFALYSLLSHYFG